MEKSVDDFGVKDSYFRFVLDADAALGIVSLNGARRHYSSSARNGASGGRPCIIGAMRCALGIVALVSLGCASKAPSVRYVGDVVGSTVMPLRAYDGEPDTPCGHVDVGTIEVRCPSGCTREEALNMAAERVNQAGVYIISKVRTTMRNGRVRSLHAVAVENFPCVTRDPLLPPPATLAPQ
jgi:hypothetical protein